MTFIIEINENDLQILFKEKAEAFDFVLNYFITKISTINTIKSTNKLFGNLKYNLNNIIIKEFKNYGSFTYNTILFNFDNFTFYQENNNIVMNCENDKINLLKQFFNKKIDSECTYEKDVTLIDELYNEDSIIEDIEYSEEEINKQRELISKLNKKKELLEEINNKFNVDYDLYFKIKSDFREVPDIFKYKYEVFSEMEDNNFINDKDKSKKYYTENYNRINKNIGSSIFSNIFFQTEKEENL